jgi:hypothetical protein
MRPNVGIHVKVMGLPKRHNATSIQVSRAKGQAMLRLAPGCIMGLADGTNGGNMSKKTDDGVCQACGRSGAKSSSELCEYCHQRDLPPKVCKNCKKESERAGLPLGKMSAYPHQECEFCGYNYFVPEVLARILLSKKPEPLSSVSLEWIFFWAWDWNTRNSTGHIPMIDVNKRGARAYLSGKSIPTSTWTEMYWGGEIAASQDYLLPIMEKYSHYPQLWYQDAEHTDDGEDGFVTIHCYPRWQTSLDQDQEDALRKSLASTKSSSEQDSLVVGFINRLI